MTARYAVTLFVSAMLLFTCQPLIARMIVPLFGGASTVWILCSLCFQALLLAGYGYAHYAGRTLSLRAQVIVQLVLVAAAFAVLPIGIDDEKARLVSADRPMLGLVNVLFRTVALPFFVLSTTSPLLQRWFAKLGENDPYFLYASSNAGSMVALLGYPLVLEPLLTVRTQSRVMQMAWLGYALLVALCAWTTTRKSVPSAAVDEQASATPISWRERLTWVALAFAPSSLFLGATQFITTDIASVPLLWVLPLAAYLASFIVAFARKQPLSDEGLSRAFAFVAAIVALLLLGNLRTPVIPLVAAHVVFVFIASTVCHRALARRRPHVSRLTEFYLLTSVGGVLGGAFNGLVAPVVFSDLYELPLAIGATLAARAAFSDSRLDKKSVAKDIVLGLGVAGATFAVAAVLGKRIEAPSLRLLAVFAPPVFVAFHWSRANPIRSAVAVAAVLLFGMHDTDDTIVFAHASRGFYGVLRYGEDPSRKFRVLVDGRTIHGRQTLDEAGRGEALSYYHPTGPAGDVLSGGGEQRSLQRAERSLQRPGRRVALIGLGAAALAAYAKAGEHWTFFEINPEVVAIANRHFTYLADARTRAKVDVEVGDGRLLLKALPEHSVDIVVLDAFSSDAVPMHLLTKDALAVYRRALKPGGLIIANVSNLVLRLQLVFGALARDAGIGALERIDTRVSPELRSQGKDGSEWVLLSEQPDVQREGWTPIVVPASQAVWTDDFVNVFGVLR